MALTSHYTSKKVIHHLVPGLYRSEATGMIALMHSYSCGCFCGVVVETGTQSKDKIGHSSDDWIASSFKPFIGSVTLVQD